MHMTQQSFADLLNVTRVSVANYETNKRLPKLDIAYRILDVASSRGIKLKLEDIYSREKIPVDS